jgi:hypothetical protein
MENNIMSYLFNDLVGFKGNVVDAFNRLKVSNPFTLFDSQQRYTLSDKWDYVGVSGGTYSYNPVESTVSLTSGTTSGSKMYVETKRVFPYQPGKSLTIVDSFAMAQPKSGLRQRVGYFGITGGVTAGTPYNGVYLQQDGLTLSVCLTSASLGTTQTVTQSNWNGDKFDGTGDSGVTIDVTKGNIFWLDVEWLGVGDVRTGFFIDGKPVVAHTFYNTNKNSTTYMSTACLPLRYEIENTAGQTGSSTMRQICSTILSEGGYEGFSRRYNVTHSGTTPHTLTTAGTQYPLVAIRMAPDRLDSIIVPSNISVAIEPGTNNKPLVVQYRILLNPTLTGGAWQTHFNGNVQYNITATGVTGGTDIIGEYISSFGTLDVSSINDFNFQIGRTQLGVSDTFVLVLVPTTNNTQGYTDLSWFEII